MQGLSWQPSKSSAQLLPASTLTLLYTALNTSFIHYDPLDAAVYRFHCFYISPWELKSLIVYKYVYIGYDLKYFYIVHCISIMETCKLNHYAIKKFIKCTVKCINCIVIQFNCNSIVIVNINLK